MKRVAKFTVRHYKLLIVLFAVFSLISAILALLTKVNFDLTAFLPKDTPSSKAIDVMDKEFNEFLPDAEIAVPNINIAQALEMKKKIEAEPYVLKVSWLDDFVKLKVPLDVQNKKLVDRYYKDGTALYRVITKPEAEAKEIIRGLRKIGGENAAVRGQRLDIAQAQDSVTTEMTTILVFAIPAALIILALSTASWLEPLLFMLVILLGVVLNYGSNVFLGEISFVTQAVGAVLQMAVTMDFAIFFLHRMTQYRREGKDIKEAVELAICKSAQPILASAVTTICGFLALIFMRFRLGPDMGIVLAKGIVFSLLSVFFLLPSLILVLYKWLDKSTHRSFLPSFSWLGSFVTKCGIPILIIFLIAATPAFLAQRVNHFTYGVGSYPENSRAYRDEQSIKSVFGEEMQMVVLAPRGELQNEKKLVQELKNVKGVNSVISYVGDVGTALPPEMLPDKVKKQLLSENYSRIILSAENKGENEAFFKLASDIRSVGDSVYGADRLKYLGEVFVISDMRDTIQKDNVKVNRFSILAVAFIIALSFRSLILPFLLVLTIEISIWINLAIPYFTGSVINYIGYLIISSVQLGATVDYAILLTQYYLDLRKRMPAKEAAGNAVSQTAPSVITPALVLASAGFVLYLISSNSVIRELGMVLGRGALLSLFSVLNLLPNLLRLFDPLVGALTLKSQFYKVGRRDQNSTERRKMVSGENEIEKSEKDK